VCWLRRRGSHFFPCLAFGVTAAAWIPSPRSGLAGHWCLLPPGISGTTRSLAMQRWKYPLYDLALDLVGLRRLVSALDRVSLSRLGLGRARKRTCRIAALGLQWRWARLAAPMAFPLTDWVALLPLWRCLVFPLYVAFDRGVRMAAIGRRDATPVLLGQSSIGRSFTAIQRGFCHRRHLARRLWPHVMAAFSHLPHIGPWSEKAPRSGGILPWFGEGDG